MNIRVNNEQIESAEQAREKSEEIKLRILQAEMNTTNLKISNEISQAISNGDCCVIIKFKDFDLKNENVVAERMTKQLEEMKYRVYTHRGSGNIVMSIYWNEIKNDECK